MILSANRRKCQVVIDLSQTFSQSEQPQSEIEAQRRMAIAATFFDALLCGPYNVDPTITPANLEDLFETNVAEAIESMPDPRFVHDRLATANDADLVLPRLFLYELQNSRAAASHIFGRSPRRRDMDPELWGLLVRNLYTLDMWLLTAFGDTVMPGIADKCSFVRTSGFPLSAVQQTPALIATLRLVVLTCVRRCRGLLTGLGSTRSASSSVWSLDDACRPSPIRISSSACLASCPRRRSA